MKSKKKKNKRLLVHVGLIAGILLAVAIVINAFAVYHSNTHMYLNIIQKDILRDVNHVSVSLSEIPGLDWMLKYWYENKYEMMIIPADVEKAQIKMMDAGIFSEYLATEEFLEATDPDIQMAVCATIYWELFEEMIGAEDRSEYDVCACVKVDNPENEQVVLPYILDPNNRGELIPESIREYYASGKNTEPVFKLEGSHITKRSESKEGDTSTDEEVADGGPAENESYYELFYDKEETYYNAYIPVVHDGQVKLVISVAYKWQGVKDEITKMVKRNIIVSLICMTMTCLLILVFIYRKTLRPLTSIQKGVRRYIEDKNVEGIVREMAKITTRNEVGVLADDISLMSTEMENYTKEIAEFARETARVSSELDVAREIQSNMLPNTFPAFPDRKDFDIYASMSPAKEVGGDFYDFFLIDDDHIGLVIADVSGKGVPAALFMMISRTLIKNYLLEGMSPEKAISKVNDVICTDNPGDLFITIWAGVVELSTGKVVASNAAHEYPIIKRPGGRFEFFKDSHDFVVGGIEGMEYNKYELTLEPGSTLIVFTDGVPEATDSDQQLFGGERLVDALNSSPGNDPKTLLTHVKKKVDEFVGKAPQFDDITMLAFTLLKK